MGLFAFGRIAVLKEIAIGSEITSKLPKKNNVLK